MIEVRNNADNTAYAAEKALKEFGDKYRKVKSEIETKVADLRSKAQGEDIEPSNLQPRRLDRLFRRSARVSTRSQILRQVVSQVNPVNLASQGQPIPVRKWWTGK